MHISMDISMDTSMDVSMDESMDISMDISMASWSRCSFHLRYICVGGPWTSNTKLKMMTRDAFSAEQLKHYADLCLTLCKLKHYAIRATTAHLAQAYGFAIPALPLMFRQYAAPPCLSGLV